MKNDGNKVTLTCIAKLAKNAVGSEQLRVYWMSSVSY